MRRAAAMLLFLTMVGCGPSGQPPTATPGATSVPAGLPSPQARVPTDPADLAATIVRVDGALTPALRRWVAGGTPSPPPADVALLALYQQRIFGTLAADRTLSRAVASRLPPGLAAPTEANVSADRALATLAGPPSAAPRLKTQAPLPAGALLRDYTRAQRRFGVAWQVLAAINMIESRFGRVVSSSSAGAQGPMQFVPATWKAYGMGGDVRDPRDAMMGAANYLRSSGAPASYRRAVYAYNPSRAYVDAVLGYAAQMRRDPLAFYDYYNWQVFAPTPSGDRQITGPGA